MRVTKVRKRVDFAGKSKGKGRRESNEVMVEERNDLVSLFVLLTSSLFPSTVVTGVMQGDVDTSSVSYELQ